MAFLLPLISSIGSAVAAAAPVVAGIRLLSGGPTAPAPAAPPSPPMISSRSYDYMEEGLGMRFPTMPSASKPFTATYATYVTPRAGVSGTSLALPGMAAGVPKSLVDWLKKYVVLYGPAVAEAVWIEFQKRRRSGQTTALARAAIDSAHPEIHRVRIVRGGRRRMNPANIRALRRALRRVRSFKRVTRKVKGLGVMGRVHYTAAPRRRRRRGDLWDVEDQADVYDEAEDLGYDPYFFDPDEEP